jgi:iron complex outermembrane receptor protein
MNKLVAGAATAVIALSIGAAAHAQSTAGQAQEVVVTGARAARSMAGLAVQVNEAKDEAIITKQFIETQTPSANFAQLVNLVPGVSYSTEDPAGFNSGDLRIHSFDAAHVAVVLDGVPLNDTGNYAVYPGEYVIGEQVERITVNIGSSDVDSPSASALGATINITTKTPPKTIGGELKVSGGSYGYGRVYGELDSGSFGPWGTTAMIGGEYGRVDNFENRPGDGKRWNINAKIYQPLNGTDFISLAGLFTSERQYPAFNLSAAQRAAYGQFYYGDNYTWIVPTPQAGKADSYATGIGAGTNALPGYLIPGTVPGTVTYSTNANFYGGFDNPVDFGILHGQSKFTLGHGLTFTFDPSFFYTLANGGGLTSLAESDKRLIGNATTTPAANSKACVVGGKVTGVDLNGDGDCLDNQVVYSPSNTQTYRYGLTTSLLYDLNEANHFQLSYTYDLGRHRQTGEYSPLNQQNGLPLNVFGGRPGYGPQILTADGTTLQKRDRYSIAELNQISANYIGKFLDDKLHINIGVRAPYFTRKINQFCYTYGGTNAWCDSISFAAVQNAYNADTALNKAAGAQATNLTNLLGTTITTGPSGRPNIVAPYHQTYDYNKLLPNAGVSYRFNEHHLFYASYAGGFSAPVTDNLYISNSTGLTSPTKATIRPETSNNFTAGYRYQTRNLNISIGLYDTDYKNRIVTSYDPTDPTIRIDRNIGTVRVDGIDIEAGWNPIEHLNLYASANFNESELKNNYTLVSGTTTYQVPSQGKELVLTPDHTYALRASYDFGPLRVGAQGKYTGRRYVTDTNDASIPAFAVFGVDARLTLPYLNNRSYIQLNVQNLFNKSYISRATTNSFVSYQPAGFATPFTNTEFYYTGAPSTIYLTLGAKF